VRFVVLHHTGFGPEHYDLMFERADDVRRAAPLETFRSPCWPIASRVRLERLGDHRRAYLEYEGPLSGGRGEVRRVAAGEYQLISKSGEVCYVLSAGVEVRLDATTDEATAGPIT
jgi:hypothetical protein